LDKIYNEEIHNLCATPDTIRVIKSRKMRWAGHVAHMGELRNAYRILFRKLDGKRPLRRARCRWKGNTRMDLKENGWEGVDWMHVAQDEQWQALMNTVMNIWVSHEAGNFLTS
jgi:hypothetical protein